MGVKKTVRTSGEKPGASAPSAEPAPAMRPCPICGKPAVIEMRPFCSKRCADIDLHRWLGGTYAIPVVEEPDGDRDGFEDET